MLPGHLDVVCLNAILQAGQSGPVGVAQPLEQAGQAAQPGRTLRQAAAHPVRQLGATGGMGRLVLPEAGQQLVNPGGKGVLEGSLHRLIGGRYAALPFQLLVQRRQVTVEYCIGNL